KRNPISAPPPRRFFLSRLKISLAFCPDSYKNAPNKRYSMAHPGSVVSTLAPKGVAGLAIALLVLATLFGVLNGKKMKMLEATLASAQAARDTAERRARNQANSQGADSTETTARA